MNIRRKSLIRIIIKVFLWLYLWPIMITFWSVKHIYTWFKKRRDTRRRSKCTAHTSKQQSRLDRLNTRLKGEPLYARYFFKAHIKDYVAFDTETTGIDVSKDRIIEIAAVRVRNEQIVDEFSCLVNPGKKIPCETTRINGIDNDMIRGMPRTKEALTQFASFVGNDILAGHNAENFDFPLLNAEANRCHLPSFENKVLDTLWVSRIYFKTLSNHKLGSVCKHICHTQVGAHRALDDARSVHAIVEAARNVYRANPET